MMAGLGGWAGIVKLCRARHGEVMPGKAWSSYAGQGSLPGKISPGHHQHPLTLP